MAENRAREREQRRAAATAATRARLLTELDSPTDEGTAERVYEEGAEEALVRVKRKQSRGDYEAEWEWTAFRVAELGDVTKPFDEQDERVKRDARRVP
jgi:hypothetical protein